MSCNQATRETITGSWGNGERAWVWVGFDSSFATITIKLL